jgi:hypothetical protein
LSDLKETAAAIGAAFETYDADSHD